MSDQIKNHGDLAAALEDLTDGELFAAPGERGTLNVDILPELLRRMGADDFHYVELKAHRHHRQLGNGRVEPTGEEQSTVELSATDETRGVRVTIEFETVEGSE